MKYTPHDYQKRGIKFMLGQACGALFLDPGMGKTSITMAALKVLRKAGAVTKMLVIAPLRPAQSTWPQEVEKWDEFKDLKVGVLHGARKLDVLRDKKINVHVINPEGLRWLFGVVGGGAWPWEMLVVDESTRFKHANTQRFKTLRPYLEKFRRRYILTGSPAPNGLLDLFGQIYILDGGASLGRFITHYRSVYFDSTGYGGYTYVPRRGAAEAINKKIEPLTMRMSAEDYLSLPPLIENRVEVVLPPAARKAYDQMETLMITSIKDGTVLAANAAAATGKCRQIANGGIYHAGGVEWTHLHEAKVDAVEELVEELSGKPALVAYEFKHDLERLQRRFPNAPFIGGGVSAVRFKEIEAAWNAGEIPVLLAQPQSVAHGLNLQGTGAAVIMLGIPWDLEVMEQFVRRVWRQGQKEAVVQHFIVAKDTVDEAVVKALRAKDRTQRALLAALKVYTEERS